MPRPPAQPPTHLLPRFRRRHRCRQRPGGGHQAAGQGRRGGRAPMPTSAASARCSTSRRRASRTRSWSPPTTASAPSSRSPSTPAGTPPSASISSPCASTICWRRAPSRCSSSTTSPAASSTWRPRAAVIAGIAEGCRQAGCALIGGETAEMPGMYAEGDYDLAGFAVGAVERGAAAAAPRHRRGRRADRAALVGRAFQRLFAGAPAGGRGEARLGCAGAVRRRRQSLAEALLAPTRIYVKPVLAAIRATGAIKALAHITGGGLSENLPRVLPAGWPRTSISAPGRRRPCSAGCSRPGDLDDAEMLRTFNCGIGLVLVVAQGERGRGAGGAARAAGEAPDASSARSSPAAASNRTPRARARPRPCAIRVNYGCRRDVAGGICLRRTLFSNKRNGVRSQRSA